MNIQIKFFASCREIVGVREMRREMVAGSTVRDLWSVLKAEFSGLGELGENLFLARNGEYARPEDRLEEGDVVAFIPPVSGG